MNENEKKTIKPTDKYLYVINCRNEQGELHSIVQVGNRMTHQVAEMIKLDAATFKTAKAYNMLNEQIAALALYVTDADGKNQRAIFEYVNPVAPKAENEIATLIKSRLPDNTINL